MSDLVQNALGRASIEYPADDFRGIPEYLREAYVKGAVSEHRRSFSPKQFETAVRFTQESFSDGKQVIISDYVNNLLRRVWEADDE